MGRGAAAEGLCDGGPAARGARGERHISGAGEAGARRRRRWRSWLSRQQPWSARCQRIRQPWRRRRRSLAWRVESPRAVALVVGEGSRAVHAACSAPCESETVSHAGLRHCTASFTPYATATGVSPSPLLASLVCAWTILDLNVSPNRQTTCDDTTETDRNTLTVTERASNRHIYMCKLQLQLAAVRLCLREDRAHGGQRRPPAPPTSPPRASTRTRTHLGEVDVAAYMDDGGTAV